MGWTGRATRYCQLIRETNKSKRVDFCQKLLRTHESFNDIVFTDESMIQLKPKSTTRQENHGDSDPHLNTLLKSIFGVAYQNMGQPMW